MKINSQKNLKRPIIKPLLIILVLITLLFSGCEKDSIIRIGVAVPQSGDLALHGISTKNAVMLAADKQNISGGLLGKKIQIIVEDDVCKPEIATNVASKMVSEGVIAVIGHFCDRATLAAMPIYHDNNILVISPSSISPELTLKGDYPLFFRTIPHEATQAILQTRFISEYLRAKKVAIVHDKGFYEKKIAISVKEGLTEKNIDVVLFNGIKTGEVDYSNLIKKIETTSPEVVLFSGYYPEAAKIVAQSRKKGIKADFLSGDSLKDPSFVKITGKYAEGYYISATTDISNNPIAIQVKKDLRTRGQKPGNYGLQAHAAISSVFKAIEQSNSTRAEDLAKTLKSEIVTTTLGDISFDERGDIVGSGFIIYQVKNGKFVAVNW